MPSVKDLLSSFKQIMSRWNWWFYVLMRSFLINWTKKPSIYSKMRQSKPTIQRSKSNRDLMKPRRCFTNIMLRSRICRVSRKIWNIWWLRRLSHLWTIELTIKWLNTIELHKFLANFSIEMSYRRSSVQKQRTKRLKWDFRARLQSKISNRRCEL